MIVESGEAEADLTAIVPVSDSHMSVPPPVALRPRKLPRQARAKVTIDAICEATIQVLQTEGAARLTTTRVADRAGVSVGTLYQYFPHKDALLYALLARQLDGVAGAIDDAHRRYRGQSLAVMTDGLIATYLDAETERFAAWCELYAAASAFDTSGLVAAMQRRTCAAMTPLLASATDARFPDLAPAVFTLQMTLSGAVCRAFDRGATPSELAVLRRELPLMCRGYLSEVARRDRAAVPSDSLPGNDS